MTTATSPNRGARIIIAILLALGVLLTLWFGVHATRSFRHVRERGFRPPPMATADVSTLRGWMTVPYVADTYGAPEDYLFRELEIPAEGNRSASLVDLNRRYRTGPEGQVLRELQEAIQRFQSDPPHPSHGPPDSPAGATRPACPAPPAGGAQPMSTSLSELVLTGMLAYGAYALGLALLLGAVGLPLPGTLLLLATGAFVRQGYIDLPSALGLGLAGVVLGDSIGYAIGWLAGTWAQRRYGATGVWQSAVSLLERRGWLAIYLTRFLLTPLAVPVNLIAGAGSYGYWRFLLFDLLGEATWLLLYGSVGYVVGSQWEAVSEFASNFTGLLVGLVVLGVGVALALRYWRRPSPSLAVAAPVAPEVLDPVDSRIPTEL